MTDHLADALNTIKTHEMVGQNTCSVRASSIIAEVLKVLKEHKYLKDYSLVDNGRGGFYEVQLDGRINDCGVIKPRSSVKNDEFPKWEKRFLPSRDFGILVVSTSKGVMSHKEAKEAGLGGKLVAYVY